MAVVLTLLDRRGCAQLQARKKLQVLLAAFKCA